MKLLLETPAGFALFNINKQRFEQVDDIESL